MNPTHEKDFDTAPIEEVHQYLVENNISGSHLMRDIAKAVYRIRMDERGKCLALLDHDLSYRLAVRFFERNAALVESEGYGILYEDFERLTECGPEQFHEYRSRWIAGNRERAAHGHMTRNDTENLKPGDEFKLISLQGNDAFNGDGCEGETFRVIEHDREGETFRTIEYDCEGETFRIIGHDDTVDCIILSAILKGEDSPIFGFRPGFEFELVE